MEYFTKEEMIRCYRERKQDTRIRGTGTFIHKIFPHISLNGRPFYKVEPQNLLYAPERDPFELYNRLEKLMQDYKDTLQLIEGQICFGFALLTSKLLALGVLLIGLKYEDEVQVYNVNSSKYDIADKRKIIDANKHSEPFLMWINGEPYV